MGGFRVCRYAMPLATEMATARCSLSSKGLLTPLSSSAAPPIDTPPWDLVRMMLYNEPRDMYM